MSGSEYVEYLFRLIEKEKEETKRRAALSESLATHSDKTIDG